MSTLDKEVSAPWTEPVVDAETDWGRGGSDSWSDAVPAPATPTPLNNLAPAPDSGWGSTSSGWGGATATPVGGASSADSWGGAQAPESVPGPATPRTPELSTPAAGWLGGDGPADNWAAPSPSPSPVSPASSPSGGAGSPAKALSIAEEDDGWGSSSSLATSTPSSNGMALGVGSPPKPIPGPSQGWLGGDDRGATHVGDSRQPAPESEAGWLTSGPSPTNSTAAPPVSNGWLGGDDHSAPSMTEMVDRAIGVEEADDFVDDSWVDEEVTDGEFDDLEIPEYIPPTPEVGGAFVKMLLVAVLVLFIGGGVMFMKQEKKTPEQIQTEERAKELDFARSSVEMAKTNLNEGKPLLAVGPLEAAMTSFKTLGAEQKEILDTKVLLARALMKGQEYQKAYDHWAALTKAPEAYRKEAKEMMREASKQLRLQANAGLDEANDYIKAGESTSVLSLGRNALKIFEDHNGTQAQVGKAYGVMGRGYLNGREYGNAREALKKAMALNPAGRYTADLNKISAATAEQTSYYSGGGSSRRSVAPVQPRVITIDARIDSGSSVPQGTYVAPQGRRSSSGSNGGSAPSVSSAPPKTQAIPAYRQSNNRSSSGSGGRRGDKDVVPGYRSPR